MTEAYDFGPARLAQPAIRALVGAGFTRLDQLTEVREAELLKLHGVGPNAIKQLRSALAAQGKGFASAGPADTRR